MNHSFENIGSANDVNIPTIFLPGWAFDGRMLQLRKPVPAWIYPGNMLDPQTIDQDLLQLAAEKNIKKFRLVGWSMGAMLGLEFAARYSGLVDSLVLISIQPHWSEPEIEAIRAEFSRDPAAFLKGFYRKCFLGDKQIYRKFCTDLEPLYIDKIENNFTQLQNGLDFLGKFEIPDLLPNIPVRLIHGGQDIIAPLTEMPTLPGAETEVIDSAGHAPFFHESCTLQQELKKKLIRQKFSRAANSYDYYARVQSEVARRLAEKLPEAHQNKNIKTILEIGCGTGNFTSMLADRFPNARIVALDFSPEMIAIARHKLNNPNLEFICAEGEMYLHDARANSFDLVVSNGSLQWFSDIEKTMHNIARILTSCGSMFCSIFGPQSLQELGKGLQYLQNFNEHLAARTFPGMQELQQILQESFQESSGEEECIAKEYKSTHDLLLHIKKTGTAGWHRKIKHSLTPSRINLLDEWFTKTYGSCKVTYQIFFLQAKNL
ncbi:MAG: malonyl-ACP O-methyltransferase BioC [Deltaproteobacteria bacterium]|jgi:malonyl-CoA O-methyltransferase|nr:malonyl-ACP O-methyltransferase BioC [Deltaproteobacteria bacterium]